MRVALRPWWSRTSVIGAGALLAAALGIWQAARVADALGFGPGAPTAAREAGPGSTGHERRPGPGPAGAGARAGDPAPAAPPLAAAPWREGGSSGTIPLDGPAGGAGVTGLSDQAATDGGTEYRTDAEREAAQRLEETMRRFLSDLEFTPGNREPRQQTVVPSPIPWSPPPDVGARPPPVIEAIAPRSAPASGGARVVISGRHLRVAQVMFGAKAARITSASGEAVTVEAPPGSTGPVTIAVTNDDGSWSLAGQPFTYLK